MGHRAGLGQAVTLGHLGPDSISCLTLDITAERCRAGEDLLDTGQVVLIDQRMLGQGQDDWWD